MRVLLATAITTILLLAGCAATPFDAVEAPTWQSGYAFTYDVEGSVKGQASYNEPGAEPETETIDESFGPVKAYSYEIISTKGPSATYIAAFLMHDMMGGMMDMQQATAIRKADLTMLPTAINGQTLAVVNNTVVDLAFPLTAGKSWSYTMASVPEGMEDGIGELSVRAEATQATETKIGNETVKVIEVVHRITAPEFQKMLSDAEKEMEAQGLDASISGSFSGKRVILYSPTLEAVVRDSLKVDFNLAMTLKFDGQTMSVKADTHATVISTLSGMDRLPEADRDVAQAIKFITSGQPIEAPGVVELPGEAFPLKINQTAVEVNAADSPTVTFTAVGNIPATANLTWGIYDAVGTKVASGAGEKLDFVVAKPGSYGVQVIGRDANGRLAASASSLLIGDYDGTITLPCGPVAVTGPMNLGQPCGTASFEVPAGLQSFTLQMASGSPVPSPGAYRLSDGSNSFDRQTQNGAAGANSDNTALNPGTWTMQWRPTVGVASAPTVHVVLDYGSAPATAPDAMESAFALLRSLDLPFALPF